MAKATADLTAYTVLVRVYKKDSWRAWPIIFFKILLQNTLINQVACRINRIQSGYRWFNQRGDSIHIYLTGALPGA
jgi:hypothetical protein